MLHSFQVRPLNAGDHARVNELARAADLELELETELAKPWAALWVAGEAAGGPVASYALVWHVADELELVQIATAPELRRRGAGRALLEAVLTFGVEQACQAVHLEVRRGNDAAIRLYHGLGFDPTGVRRGYYSDGEDAVQMRHSLRS